MIFLTIILGLVPGFAWLFFYLREDLHPEPKRLIAMAFGVGILAAVVALEAEVILNEYLLPIINIHKFSILAVVVFALVEEVAKFGAAYLTVKNSREFDEPIDAMIYMVVAALGFATLENIGALGGFSGSPGDLANVSDIVHLSSMRFVGATLLHTLSSSVIGYYWAKGIREFKNTSKVLMGILLATLLHAAFNYFIIVSEKLTYSLLLVVIVGFFTLNDFEEMKQKAV